MGQLSEWDGRTKMLEKKTKKINCQLAKKKKNATPKMFGWVPGLLSNQQGARAKSLAKQNYSWYWSQPSVNFNYSLGISFALEMNGSILIFQIDGPFGF